jgi:imidazolonepropionase
LPHHLVFAATGPSEHAMRRAGASYEEIARAGGGIASTVAKTRAASTTSCSSKAGAAPQR